MLHLSSGRLLAMRRFDFVEPMVMLATVAQWLVLATITGTIVGSGTSLFLHGLFSSTGRTADIPFWLQMVLLPSGGLLNGLLLHYGYRANTTGLKDTLFAAINTQAGRMPLRTMLIKPIAAIITLASGGSAGKEGPCSHIGASLASAIAQLLHLNEELRLRIVACGVSAGFASVFGTPIAGAIYGVEVLAIGRIRHDFLFPAIVAGVASYRVSVFWGVPYQYYRPVGPLQFPEILFLKAAVLGVICGIVALVFVEFVHRGVWLSAWLRTHFRIWPPLMPLCGGILLSFLILVIPLDYLGLSLPLMNRALAGQPMPYLGFLWKSLLVAITLGSGFYGGVVTPQFVIGALAGNAFAPLVGIGHTLGAAIGLVSVVAAASNTPVAAVIMGVELYSGTIGALYVAGAAIAAYVTIGHRSIYLEQRLAYSKSSWMRISPGSAVGTEKARLSSGLLRILDRRHSRSKKP
ncbi:MAG: chloride channel protein [Acetobacteraceae bacterium]